MNASSSWQSPGRERLIALSLLAVLVGAAWGSGAFHEFRSPEQVHALIDSWGAWAYVLYVLTFVLLMPFGIPAFVWVLPAGALWPFWLAYPLSLLAVAGASSLGFLFARYIARDWVSARLPGRIRRIDEHFSSRGLRAVILFRLVFQLGAPTHWLLGLSKVDYTTFVLGTVIGAMPAVALVAWLGHEALHWVQMHLLLALGILVAIIAVLALARRLMLVRRHRVRAR